MDGGRALRALLSYRVGRGVATRLATQIGHALAIGFGIFGFMSGQPLLMFVALFVYLGASAENNDVQMRQMARGLRVSDAMITVFKALSVTDRIGDAVAVLNHSTQHDIPIVDGVGKLIGLLTRNQILKSLHDHGPNIPVAEVMRTDIPVVSDQAELDQSLRLMDEQKLPAIAVSDPDGRLVGMVTLENLGQMMLLRQLRPVDYVR
jgi:stage IV sporulation protein FB